MNHRYSTIMLIIISFIMIIGITIANIDNEVNELCNTPNSILYKFSNTWGCGTNGTGITFNNGIIELQNCISGQIQQYNGSHWLCTTSTSGTNLTGTGTTSYLSAWTNSSNLNSSVLYQSGKNIGLINGNLLVNIGTPSGSYGTGAIPAITVGNNTATGAGSIKLHGSTAGAYGLLQATTNNLHIDAVTAGLYLNYYSGTFTDIENSVIRIDGSKSRVGVRTASPFGRLQVNNNYINSPSGGIYLATSGYGYNTTHLVPDLIVTSDNNSVNPGASIGLALHNNDNNTNVFAPLLVFSKRETGATAYNAVMAAIGAKTVTGSGSGGSYIDGEMTFYTAPTAGAGILERMRITQGGNIGINITNPTAKLQINQDDTLLGLYVTGGNAGYPLASFKRDIGSDGRINVTSAGNDVVISYEVEGGRLAWYTGAMDTTYNNFVIGYNGLPSTGNNVITLENNSYVGINNSNPAYTLDVNGDIEAEGKLRILNDENTDTPLLVTTTTGKAQLRLLGNASNEATLIMRNLSDTNVIAFSTQADSYLLNSDLGIGTTSPAYPLVVARNTSGIAATFYGNITAHGYITGTEVYTSKNEAYKNYKNSSEYLNPNKTVKHSARPYAYVTYTTQELSGYRQVKEKEDKCYPETVCKTITDCNTDQETEQTICTEREECTDTEYCTQVTVNRMEPIYTEVNREGWSLDRMLAEDAQAIYELNQRLTQIDGQLKGTYTGGSRFVCVYNNGTIYTKESSC